MLWNLRLKRYTCALTLPRPLTIPSVLRVPVLVLLDGCSAFRAGVGKVSAVNSVRTRKLPQTEMAFAPSCWDRLLVRALQVYVRNRVAPRNPTVFLATTYVVENSQLLGFNIKST